MTSECLWMWDVDSIGRWVRGIQALFPSKKPNDANINPHVVPTTSTEMAAAMKQKEEEAAEMKAWTEEINQAERLCCNLLNALASATYNPKNGGNANGDENSIKTEQSTTAPIPGGVIPIANGNSHPAATAAPTMNQATSWKEMEKMAQKERALKVRAKALVAAGVMKNEEEAYRHVGLGPGGVLNKPTPRVAPVPVAPPPPKPMVINKKDAFCILDPSFAKGKDVVHISGAVLSRLGMGGLLNALCGVEGGVVDSITSLPLPTVTTNPKTGKKEESNIPNPILTPQVKKFARVLKRAVAARLEMDMLEATPTRIVEMLCPEVSPPEIAAIRKRIVDTVILNKGTNASVNAAALEEEGDLPVAAKTAVHAVEAWKKCKDCGNNDQAAFAMDRKNGDLICTQCGTVASESLMHEGSQFRKFEGEADRNHHGDAANPLYSNAHNMSTTLGGLGFQSGAGVGWGMGSKRGMENILRNAHAYTEMNISQFGKEEKKTRVGYKDRQKKDAFVKMTHVGDALSLHDAVVQRAKELFAGFRDDRELVQQFKGVVAACLSEAFDQLSKDGRQILKVQAGGEDDEEENLSGRASWRSKMHDATAASTTVFSDIPSHLKEAIANNDAKGNTLSVCETKPAASWDIDDCRTWLLEASRSIAKQWSEANNEAEKTGAPNTSAIPQGTLDELEGNLVLHTFTLCEYLEQEMKKGKKSIISGRKHKAVTPRARDMGVLSIKWQGSHERGSGGKGGVGNSGRSTNGVKPGERAGPTAGQILSLKNSIKLSKIVKDTAAGEAFHKELKALLGRQAAQKKKEKSNENAQLRFRQMKRKPWLQARANQM